MKLSRKDIQSLHNALAQLGGRAESATNGDGKATVVVKPFDFSGKVIYGLARNKAHLKPHIEAMVEANNALVKKLGDDAGEVKPSTPAMAQMLLEQADLMNGEEEVQLHLIPIADLKIETNKLDPNLVAALLPILDGEIA